MGKDLQKEAAGDDSREDESLLRLKGTAWNEDKSCYV